MISKCANPACAARFLYLHEGKLYRFERTSSGGAGLLGLSPNPPKHPAKVEFYWLCSRCAKSMKLTYCQGIGVIPFPRYPLLKAAS